MCFQKHDRSWPSLQTPLPSHTPSSIIDEKIATLIELDSRSRLDEEKEKQIAKGQCPIHIAMAKNVQTNVIRVLISAAPETLRVADVKDGDIPLMSGAKHGCRLENIQMALKLDPSTALTQNRLGKTALMFAIEFGCATPQPPSSAMADDLANALQVIEFLVLHSPPTAFMSDTRDRTPLVRAITHFGPSNHLVVRKLLTIFLNNPKLFRINTSNTLHNACLRPVPSYPLVSSIVSLLPHTASTKDALGRTPLHLACLQPSPDVNIVSLLLQHAPQTAKIKDNQHRLPIHYACMAKGDNLPVIEQLLKVFPQCAKISCQADGGLTFGHQLTISVLVQTHNRTTVRDVSSHLDVYQRLLSTLVKDDDDDDHDHKQVVTDAITSCQIFYSQWLVSSSSPQPMNSMLHLIVDAIVTVWYHHTIMTNYHHNDDDDDEQQSSSPSLLTKAILLDIVPMHLLKFLFPQDSHRGIYHAMQLHDNGMYAIHHVIYLLANLKNAVFDNIHPEAFQYALGLYPQAVGTKYDTIGENDDDWFGKGKYPLEVAIDAEMPEWLIRSVFLACPRVLWEIMANKTAKHDCGCCDGGSVMVPNSVVWGAVNLPKNAELMKLYGRKVLDGLMVSRKKRGYKQETKMVGL